MMHPKTAPILAVMLVLAFIGHEMAAAGLAVPRPGASASGRSSPLTSFSPPAIKATDTEAPWWETTGMDLDRNGVTDVLDKKFATGSIVEDVIIDLIDGPMDQDIQALSALGLHVRGSYEIIHAITVEDMPSHMAPRILAMPRVVLIEAPSPIVLGSDVANPAVKVRESAEYSPNTVWELGYKGEGINIAVLDTGVDNGHPTFTGKTIAGADFTKPDTRLTPRDGTFDPDDIYGHGTTCAGIALGNGDPDGKYAGNAPEAGVIDGRVGTALGFSISILDFYDSILASFEWSIANKDTAWPGAPADNQGIDVVTISFWGGDGSDSDGQDAVSRGLSAVAEAGIITITIGGNAGPDNQGIAVISASDEAITTASSDDVNTIIRDDDVIASYSSRGPRKDDGDDDPWDELKPDVTAPGTNINNAINARVGDGSGNGYGDRGSGTSYAGPNVAGLAALMFQSNPDITHLIVKEILKFTAERKGTPTQPEIDPFWNRDFGYGIVDGYNATVMARDLEDIPSINVRLQAHILGVNNETGDPSKQEVFGVAWNRDGKLDMVEYRIDGGDWKSASDDANETWAQWHIKVDNGKISRGQHLVEVRAVAGEMHSLVDNITIENRYSAGAFGKVGTLQVGLLLGALVAGVAIYIIFRKMKGAKPKPTPVQPTGTSG